MTGAASARQVRNVSKSYFSTIPGFVLYRMRRKDKKEEGKKDDERKEITSSSYYRRSHLST